MDTIMIKAIFIIGIWFIYKNECFSNYGEKKNYYKKVLLKLLLFSDLVSSKNLSTMQKYRAFHVEIESCCIKSL